MQNKPHGRALRKSRHSESGHYFAITKCVEGRLPLLTKTLPDGGSTAQLVIDGLSFFHRRGEWTCLGYVVMPDHVHFVVKILERDLSSVVSRLCSHTARELNRKMNRRGQFWQRGFHDRGIRGEKPLTAFLEYMLDNPRRAGLVEEAEEWPYCEAFPDW